MEVKGFWIQCMGVAGCFFILASVVAAISTAHFHSQRSNESQLQDLKTESKKIRDQFEDDIRYLVLDLIQLQKNPQHSEDFFIYGALNKKDKNILQIQPQKFEKKFSKISNSFSIENLKNFPIAFQSISIGAFQNRQLILLVDVDQIKNPNLPEDIRRSGVLFGILSHKKIKQISKKVVEGGFSEGFLLDARKKWIPIHSSVNRSGSSLSKGSIFHKMVQEYPYGWVQDVDSEKLLTAGVQTTFSNNYLVLNQKKALWTDFFMSSLKTVAFPFLGLSLLWWTLLVLVVRPMVRAFQHVALTLRTYAFSKKFPVPESHKNPYIMQVLPWSKKIYWSLRNHQILRAISQDENTKIFSQWMTSLVQKEVENRYHKIRVNLNFKEDASIPPECKTWLEPAFLEILKNAVECMNQSGHIDICTFRKDRLFYCSVRDYRMNFGSHSKEEIKKYKDQVCQNYNSIAKNDRKLGLALTESTLSKMGGGIQFLRKTPGLETEVSLPFEDLNVSTSQTRLQL